MSLLAEIVGSTRRRVAAARAGESDAALARRAATAPAPRDFVAALRGPGIRLVAEFKPASPSRGPLRPDADVREYVAAYTDAGAAAISVLTEPRYFGSGLDRLEAARGATTLPLLRKDFVVDPYQVDEARAAGADAVLLLARLLDDEELSRLVAAAEARGMCALVEAHDAAEIGRAIEAGARVVGINQRDLGSLEIDRTLAERLLPSVPAGVPVVAESGLRDAEDLRRLRAAGCAAFLVGTRLMEASDPGAALRELLR